MKFTEVLYALKSQGQYFTIGYKNSCENSFVYIWVLFIILSVIVKRIKEAKTMKFNV